MCTQRKLLYSHGPSENENLRDFRIIIVKTSMVSCTPRAWLRLLSFNSITFRAPEACFFAASSKTTLTGTTYYLINTKHFGK